MENDSNNSFSESRSNSLSTGDPNLKNEGNTSTDSTSSKNSGESAPQSGENIVNEQEQNKSVNMEEFVENSAQNSFDDQEKSINKAEGINDVPEIGDDPLEVEKDIPSM